MSRVAALIPFTAFVGIAVSMPGAAIAADELGTWSDEQLCMARDIPEALDELERRDIFDGRELRAIRREELKKGISEDALRCMKGSPATILPAFMTLEGNAVDAFVYPPGTIGSLIVFMRRRGDASTVAAFAESAEGYTFRVSSAWTDFCSGGGSSSPAERIARAEDCGPDLTLTIQRRLGIDVLTDPPSIDPPAPQTLPSQ